MCRGCPSSNSSVWQLSYAGPPETWAFVCYEQVLCWQAWGCRGGHPCCSMLNGCLTDRPRSDEQGWLCQMAARRVVLSVLLHLASGLEGPALQQDCPAVICAYVVAC